MKKIYVMAAFLGASSFAFNQVVQKAPSHVTKDTEKAISTNNGAVKAVGGEIWSSEFDDVNEWTIDGAGQGTWEIGDSTDLEYVSIPGTPGYFSLIRSTTVENGFAFFEAAPFLIPEGNNAEVQNSWIEMTNAVDAQGEDVLTLKFEQSYRAFNHDKTYVEVSVDGGTTWEQTTDVNPTITANTTATETTIYRNFDVSNAVQGTADVKFRFRWENLSTDNAAGAGYAWQVDDVAILTLAEHDIAVRNLNYGTEGVYYHQIPVDQIAPIYSSVVLINQGSNDQTNVKFNAAINGGTYTSSSAPIDMASESEDSVTVENDFTPTNQGSYKMDYTVSFDNVDDVPSNNVMKSYKFTVGQNIYARDSSTRAETGFVNGYSSGANQTPPAVFEPGNVFDIYTNASLTGVDFQLGDIVTEGSKVYGIVNDANLDQIANGETQPYTIQAGDEGTYHTLVFDTPINLVAGETYVVTVRCYDTDFSVATAGKSAPQTSFVYYPGDDWYYTTSTPVVRMNFDPTLNVENNELSNINVTQNFPNPFANETTVEFSLKETTDVSYTVVDLTGKIMAQVNEGNTMAGDHQITIDGSSYANGVYYLNITAGESTVTRKLIVNK